MSAPACKVVIHMVSSLDGFIAKQDNSVSWFETKDVYEPGEEISADDMKDFDKKVDCYLMGSHTYELAVKLSNSYGWAYGDKPVVVLTKRTLQANRPTVRFYAGDPAQLLTNELQPKYKNVWLVGGPELVHEFLRLRLADEIRQSILPIILGDGIPFFVRLQ